MPGERSDAGRWRPVFVRDHLQRCPLRERLARPSTDASIVGSGATQPQTPSKALGPARAALARRRAPEGCLPDQASQTAANDTRR